LDANSNFGPKEGLQQKATWELKVMSDEKKCFGQKELKSQK